MWQGVFPRLALIWPASLGVRGEIEGMWAWPMLFHLSSGPLSCIWPSLLSEIQCLFSWNAFCTPCPCFQGLPYFSPQISFRCYLPPVCLTTPHAFIPKILISWRRWVELVSCLNVLHWSGLKYGRPIHSLKSNSWLCSVWILTSSASV